jgi:hypothetical protein
MTPAELKSAADFSQLPHCLSKLIRSSVIDRGHAGATRSAKSRRGNTRSRHAHD